MRLSPGKMDLFWSLPYFEDFGNGPTGRIVLASVSIK
jgi:hypothetical protein